MAIEPRMPQYTLWMTGHDINKRVMHSVSSGLKDPIRATALYNGIVKPSVSYGILRGNREIFNDCYDSGTEYWEIDRGYFKPNHFDGYYRVSMNNMQVQYHNIGTPGNRFNALNIKIAEWQKPKSGRILVIPPTQAVCDFYHINGDDWLSDVKNKLSNFRLKVRSKTDEQPLDDDIDYSDCVVVYNSNVAIDALKRGVPAIATSHNSVIKSWNGLDMTDVEDYIKLTSFSREKLFNYLAYCQWTLDELSRPQTWALMRDIQKGF